MFILGNMIPGQHVSTVHSTIPNHTTLPSHHNGVRLMLHGGSNSFVKRLLPVQMGTCQPRPVLPNTTAGSYYYSHHTFPQVLQLNGKLLPNNQPHLGQLSRQSDRDSANFSMASSGDSDMCLPH